MAEVVLKFQGEMGGSRRTGLTSLSVNSSVEIHDSLPSDQDTMRRDPGAASYSFPFEGVIDDSFVDLIALWALQGTKVDYLTRSSDDAQSATNPEWAGTSGNSNQGILEITNIDIVNGQPVAWSGTIHADGAPTFAGT